MSKIVIYQVLYAYLVISNTYLSVRKTADYENGCGKMTDFTPGC